jgi:chromosome segregation ATPase
MAGVPEVSKTVRTLDRVEKLEEKIRQSFDASLKQLEEVLDNDKDAAELKAKIEEEEKKVLKANAELKELTEKMNAIQQVVRDSYTEINTLSNERSKLPAFRTFDDARKILTRKYSMYESIISDEKKRTVRSQMRAEVMAMLKDIE